MVYNAETVGMRTIYKKIEIQIQYFIFKVVHQSIQLFVHSINGSTNHISSNRISNMHKRNPK